MNKYTVLCCAWIALATIAAFHPFTAVIIGFPLVFVTGASML